MSALTERGNPNMAGRGEVRQIGPWWIGQASSDHAPSPRSVSASAETKGGSTVTIERAYYCDGPENRDIPGDAPQPDGCPHNVKAVLLDEKYIPGGMIRVSRHVQGSLTEELHFCSWDCLLRYAATQELVEYIPGGGAA